VVIETNRVNPCAHVVANLVSKTRPQNCQNLENILKKSGISFSQTPIFLTQNSIFFNGFPISKKSKKIFFNGFPISSTAFCFLQWLSAFFNGFPIFLNGVPLSKKYEKIYLRRQVYERSLFELCISRHSLPELCNSR
jgi:hypothetical protein